MKKVKKKIAKCEDQLRMIRWTMEQTLEQMLELKAMLYQSSVMTSSRETEKESSTLSTVTNGHGS